MNDINCGVSERLSSISEIPVLTRLKSQKEQLEKQLENVNNAIEKLEANPQVYEILEALNKLGHY